MEGQLNDKACPRTDASMARKPHGLAEERHARDSVHLRYRCDWVMSSPSLRKLIGTIEMRRSLVRIRQGAMISCHHATTESVVTVEEDASLAKPWLQRLTCTRAFCINRAYKLSRGPWMTVTVAAGGLSAAVKTARASSSARSSTIGYDRSLLQTPFHSSGIQETQ